MLTACCAMCPPHTAGAHYSSAAPRCPEAVGSPSGPPTLPLPSSAASGTLPSESLREGVGATSQLRGGVGGAGAGGRAGAVCGQGSVGNRPASGMSGARKERWGTARAGYMGVLGGRHLVTEEELFFSLPRVPSRLLVGRPPHPAPDPWLGRTHPMGWVAIAAAEVEAQDLKPKFFRIMIDCSPLHDGKSTSASTTVPSSNSGH